MLQFASRYLQPFTITILPWWQCKVLLDTRLSAGLSLSGCISAHQYDVGGDQYIGDQVACGRDHNSASNAARSKSVLPNPGRRIGVSDLTVFHKFALLLM